jgi:hypothetical protein
VDQVRAEVSAERRERLDDLKLLIDLIVTGWQTVDHRLARVEASSRGRRSGWTACPGGDSW